MNFESEFIKKLKNGDKKSFEELFLELYTSLCEYSTSITKSKMTSEEVVQDVFTALWQKRKLLDLDVNIKAYLFRSVKNRSLDIEQQEQIRNKYQDEISNMYAKATVLAEINADQAKLIKRVHEEVDKLPEKSQIVYLLHRRDGLTYSEISNVLEISVKAVEARMTKALKILRDRLIKEWNDYILSPLLILILNFF
jgi:RNA polymerase sigma-70 factor, ECF subfamily